MLYFGTDASIHLQIHVIYLISFFIFDNMGNVHFLPWFTTLDDNTKNQLIYQDDVIYLDVSYGPFHLHYPIMNLIHMCSLLFGYYPSPKCVSFTAHRK